MIKPTVGRVVHYRPGNADIDGAMVRNGDQPLAAIITCVWSDSCVNLVVFDANGVLHSRTSVLLLQDGNPRPRGSFCEWMPYQKGQAAKTDELEKELSGKGQAFEVIDVTRRGNLRLIWRNPSPGDLITIKVGGTAEHPMDGPERTIMFDGIQLQDCSQ